MSTNSLELKISALVTGLKEVANLGDQFLKTAKSAEELGKSGQHFEGMGKSAKDAGAEVERAFSVLGGKSTAQIKAQMEQIKQALDKVKESGASFDEVTRASSLAEARLKQLNREMSNPAPKNLSESLASIKSKLGSLDFEGVGKEASNMMVSFQDILGVVKPLAAAFVGMAGLSALGSMAKEAANLAARVETLGITMKVVGQNAGYSAAELDKQEASVKKMGITTEVARDSITKMIQAGIRVNELGVSLDATGQRMTKAQELARAAQDLAVVTGENSSATLQRLVTNIQQMDTMGLRFMGLTVEREAAEAKFAAQIGKTADALTESQRKQAFYNATMSEAAKLAGAYENAMETVGKKLGSLQRYQDELALSMGNVLVPAYGALVDSVTDFLKHTGKMAEAFASGSSASKNFADGTKALAEGFKGGLLSVMPGVLEASESFSRAFKSISELLGPVISGLMESLPAVMLVAKGFFDGLALIGAVIKDVVMVAFGAMTASIGDVILGFGSLVSGIGTVVGLFNKDLGKSIKDAGEQLKQTGRDMAGFGDEIIKTSLSSKGAVGQFADSFNRVGESTKGISALAKDYSEEVNRLTKAQAEGAISSEDLTNKMLELSEKVLEAGKSGAISKKEFADLTKQMSAVPGTLGQAFTEAASKAGTSFEQIRGGMSKETAAGLAFMEAAVNLAATKSKAAFEAMGTDASKFGQDLLSAYSKYALGAKSVEELIAANARLKDARDKGLVSEQQLQEGLKLSTKRFDELLEAQLKSANTRQDFDRLREAVFQMGESGQLSGTKVQAAFIKIADAAGGATGKVKELADAQDRLNVQDASLQVAQAHYQMVKSEADVMRGRLEVWKAEVALAREGSDVNRLSVESAKLGLQLAQEELQLSRLKYSEQVANMDLVIAKQRELNATKRLEHDSTNEALQKEQLEARELAKTYELKVATTREQVLAQQEAILKMQEAKVLTDTQLEAMKSVTEENKRAAAAAGEHGDRQASTKAKVDEITKSVGEVDTSLKSVNTSQGQVTKGYEGMAAASTQWATTAKANAEAVRQANAAAVSAGTRADVTGKFAPGNGSLTTEDGRTVNLPKDTGVSPGTSKGVDGYTGKGWSTGKDSVNGTVSQDQINQANAQYNKMLSDFDYNNKLSSQGGKDLSVLGKNDMRAVDNSGPFVAWEKFRSGTLSPGDAALVKTVWQMSKDTMLQARSNMNAFGYEGFRDAQMWYDRSRQMMEELNLPALATGTNYVPKDMIAQLHEGEAVIPKKYNPDAGGVNFSALGVLLSGLPAGMMQPVQSIARGTQSIAQEAVKKIEVVLSSGQAKVSAMVSAGDEHILLDMLEKAKRVT